MLRRKIVAITAVVESLASEEAASIGACVNLQWLMLEFVAASTALHSQRADAPGSLAQCTQEVLVALPFNNLMTSFEQVATAVKGIISACLSDRAQLAKHRELMKHATNEADASLEKWLERNQPQAANHTAGRETSDAELFQAVNDVGRCSSCGAWSC